MSIRCQVPDGRGQRLLEREGADVGDVMRGLRKLWDEEEFSRFMRPGGAAVQFTPVANSKVFWEKTGMRSGGGGEEFGCHHGPAF